MYVIKDYIVTTKIISNTSRLLSKSLPDPSHTRLNDIIFLIQFFFNLVILLINYAVNN